ncbi:cell cycle checkpoint control protein RAD9B isoform X1 [Epinephelus fuscoguttatus]|uniref:cell cycle checkpoint control protein RAD9B isoform X1 n=1 Tax=Epinephelus fuscoguttatus TaxID=293821 RepID=UPI0020D08FD4|nr:cell cycle checkpoint control protein RAD9B isoform X1 [Epinephelus fuscoguttatus]
MNCTLEGNGVKAFGKAIHALSRISDELWLDPMVRGLALRSVNSTHSAYACFLFSPLFFQHYRLGSVSEQSSETIKCKLVMKSVLPLFRCLTSIERNVERCQISISTPNDRVTIQFFCRHGITKTHNLCFQESEALQAVFAAHLCPNVLKAPARLLGDMVTHFPVSQEEITLSVTPLRVSLRNYHEGGNDHLKFMYTEMSLHPDEFDYFQIGMESDITFCLKELRGLLSFAESHCLPVSVYFTAAGKPVCFSVEDVVLEATVVLATLIDSESRGPSQPTETLAPTILSCADAAVLPVGSCKADSSKAQGIPAEMEMVASSQGSPIINPPALMLRLPQTDNPDGLGVDDEACASVTTTPASSMVTRASCWWLLSCLFAGVVGLPVRPILVNLRNTFREFPQIWHGCPLGLKDELIRFGG